MKATLLSGIFGLVGMAGPASGVLVGHWTFNEGSGTTANDSSGGGSHATLFNASWGSDATRSSYITFTGDGGSYGDPGLNLPAALLSTTGNFTVAFWVNRDASDTEPNSIVVGNRYMSNGSDFSPRQFIKITPSKLEWHMNGNGTDNLDPGADMAGGSWHHEVVTLTSGTAQYYRDGVALGSSKAVTQSFGFDQPFYFGGQAGTTAGGEFFNGSLDDIRLYDNALNASEVNALYLATIPEPSAALLGFFGMAFFLRRRR